MVRGVDWSLRVAVVAAGMVQTEMYGDDCCEDIAEYAADLVDCIDNESRRRNSAEHPLPQMEPKP